MKQFIEKTSKVYAFEFDEIFPCYKEIWKAMGEKDFISMDFEPTHIYVRCGEGVARIDSGYVLIISEGEMRTISKLDFQQDYEEINKVNIVVKHILNDNPLTNPPHPFTYIPSQPFYQT